MRLLPATSPETPIIRRARPIAVSLALALLAGDASAEQGPSLQPMPAEEVAAPEGVSETTGAAMPVDSAVHAPARVEPALLQPNNVASGPEPQVSGPVARVGITVDASRLSAHKGALQQHIENRSHAVLDELGIPVARSPDDLSTTFSVVESVDENGDPGYIVTFSVERAGEQVPEQTRRLICTLCTEGELLDEVEGHLRQFLASDYVRSVAEQDAVPQVVRTNTNPDQVELVKPTLESRAPRLPLTPLGQAGVGTLVGGTVALAAGVTLSAIGEQPAPLLTPGGQTNVHFGRPWGYISLGVGAAAVTTGIVLLVYERKRERRRYFKRQRVARIQPALGGFRF